MISLEKIIQKAEKKIPEIDVKKIQEAYDFASKKYEGVTRLSGEPYILHALSVAESTIDYSPEEESLISALLHNISCKNKTEFNEIQEKFGESVANLIKSVSALVHIQVSQNDRQMNALRNMYMAIAKDIRVVVIALVERLQNMQTLEFLPPDDQEKVSYESLHIYAPIASRMGMFALKSPLEDLSFFYLNPLSFKKLSKQMAKHELHRDKIIENARRTINDLILKNGIKGSVTGRIKHVYSIYSKLQEKKKESIDDIYDIFAMRIIVPAVSDCYSMLGIIHEYYIPLPNRFKDYIAVPKPNGYKSLHTTVIGLSQETKKTFPIEIQIRTQEMSDEAEFGIAAHWSYKEKESPSHKNTKQPQEWIKSLIEMEEELKENNEYSNNITEDSFSERIYAITPGGDIKDLPSGATPVDFAFSIHSDIGFRMRLAKANGKLVPLNYKIQSGDVIEIVTNRDAKPNQNWISLCMSAKAKSRIRAYFHQKDADTLIREGRENLNKNLVRNGLHELDQNLSLLRNYGRKTRNKKDREEILLRIGNGSINSSAIIRDILARSSEVFPIKKSGTKEAPPQKKENEDVGIIIGENRDIPTKRASCCKPKTGDKIIGFVTRGNHVTIHRTDCKTLNKLDYRRFLDARYENEVAPQKVVIEVKRGADRVGFVNDVLSVFASRDSNLIGFTFKERSSFSATILFTIEVQGTAYLDDIIEEVKKAEGVLEVKKRGVKKD